MQFAKREKLIIAIISIIAFLAALWMFNPLPLYFLNDDLIHIPLSKEGVLFQRNSLRPIGDLSVQVDYFFWGKNAAGYHFTNLLLHVLNSLLVFFLSKRLLQKYADRNEITWHSLMVAVLFFVYAFHSETIFWILGRSGSLGTLFFIPAVIFYLKRFEKNIFFMASLLCFTLGLFAYESVWVFPLFIILLGIVDRRLFHSPIRKEILMVVIVWVVFVFYLLLRYNIINEVAGRYEAAAFFKGDVLVLAGNSARLLIRSFMPPVTNNIYLIVGAILIGVFIIACIITLRKREVNTFLGLIIAALFVSFLPYLSLGISTHHVEGERYLYMPSIFACILLITLATVIIRNRILYVGLCTLLLVYNLYFLSRSKSFYTTASKISGITFKQIDLLNGKKRLFIDSLPQTVHGALVFRLGFDEGTHWLKEPFSVDSIFILSVKQDNQHWSTDYNVLSSRESAPGIFQHILIRDSTHQQTYVLKEIPPIKFNQQTDAWFIFNSAGLEVIK